VLEDGEGVELGCDVLSNILGVLVQGHELDRMGRVVLRIEELVVRKLPGV
jgi:hypothetical protein